jgi:hypothetical protein
MDDVPPSPWFRPQGFSPSRRFASRPELAGLFHPAAVRATSFRAFPSQGSRAPLEAACSRAVRHQDRRTRSPTPCHPRFPRLPRSRALAWFPRGLWVSFSHGPKAALPVHPGRRAPGSPPHPALSASKRLVPPESPFTPTRVAPRLRPLLSWSHALLELVPLNLGASAHARPHGPGASPASQALKTCAAGSATSRTPTRPKPRRAPRCRVGPRDVRDVASTPSRASSPVWADLRRLLGDAPTPLTSLPRREPRTGPPESRSIQGVNALHE